MKTPRTNAALDETLKECGFLKRSVHGPLTELCRELEQENAQMKCLYAPWPWRQWVLRLFFGTASALMLGLGVAASAAAPARKAKPKPSPMLTTDPAAK